jgi:hypothetical protein
LKSRKDDLLSRGMEILWVGFQRKIVEILPPENQAFYI